MIEARRLETDDADQTAAIGAEIAERLGPGDVVLVVGEIGAGKTTLIQGACRALGVEVRVSSPTYTLGHRYEGRIPVSHLDLYRLADIESEDPALLDDYLTPDAVAFIEWPAVAAARIGRVAATIEIAHGGGDRREISISPGAAPDAGAGADAGTDADSDGGRRTGDSPDGTETL